MIVKQASLLAAGLVAGVLIPAMAQACAGAGVITRIAGRPQDVVIMRSEGGAKAPVSRPRVLEVICVGDTVQALNGATVTLSMDGMGMVKVAAAPYTVAARHGGANMASNAYQSVSEHLLPDMKRQPWDVRLRGGVPPLAFGVQSLDGTGQQLAQGHTQLLVRVAGGVGPYKVQLSSETGAIAAAASPTPDLLLSGLALAPGPYVLKASDSSGAEITGKFVVVASAPPSPGDYQGVDDPEVRAAATAADLARVAPGAWAFEAEQMLASAPVAGLDRGSVYELIESYTGD